MIPAPRRLRWRGEIYRGEIDSNILSLYRTNISRLDPIHNGALFQIESLFGTLGRLVRRELIETISFFSPPPPPPSPPLSRAVFTFRTIDRSRCYDDRTVYRRLYGVKRLAGKITGTRGKLVIENSRASFYQRISRFIPVFRETLREKFNVLAAISNAIFIFVVPRS